MGIEQFDQFGKIRERAGEAVDLVHHYDVDQSLSDIFEQPLQRRALHIPAGETAVIIGGLDESPAFALLALDEGGTGFALGLQ